MDGKWEGTTCEGGGTPQWLAAVGWCGVRTIARAVRTTRRGGAATGAGRRAGREGATGEIKEMMQLLSDLSTRHLFGCEPCAGGTGDGVCV